MQGLEMQAVHIKDIKNAGLTVMEIRSLLISIQSLIIAQRERVLKNCENIEFFYIHFFCSRDS